MFKTGRDHEMRQPYYRLQQALADLIAATPAGQRLLSEPDLARQMGVSRATLREAMRTFEGQGLIRRRQGIGTFVVGHSQIIESGLEVLESIEKLAHQIDLDVSMGDFQVIQLNSGPDEATELNVASGTPLLQVIRVITAEERPVAYLVDLLPQSILSPTDLEHDFTGSVLDFLLRRGEPHLSESHTEIQAVAASSEIARALQIQRGDVLLQFNARLFTAAGHMIDFSSSYFLPGYFRFHVIRRIGNGHIR